MEIPKSMIVIGVILLLGSWFLLGEKKSFLEKLLLLAGILAVYASYRLMSGATMEQILAPLTQ